jgi:hypothetical protein
VGYDVEMTLYDVVIPAANVPAAIQAFKKLMDVVQERGGGGSYAPDKTPVRHYSWVQTQTVLDALGQHDLKAAIEEWRYSVSLGEEATPTEQLAAGHEFRDVVVDYFSGSKWGDDEQLWYTLGPFLHPDAVIECRGEDDNRWRYLIVDGGVVEQTGCIVWE